MLPIMSSRRRMCRPPLARRRCYLWIRRVTAERARRCKCSCTVANVGCHLGARLQLIMKSARCGTCYTPIFSHYGGRMLLSFVRVGTLDSRPDWLRPDVHIYTNTKVPWYTVPKEALMRDESYDLDDVLSKESLERMAKLREKMKAETLQHSSSTSTE